MRHYLCCLIAVPRVPRVKSTGGGGGGTSPVMFMCDTEAGALKGYGVKKQEKDLVARELWTVNLMKDSQTITNVVAKRQNGECINFSLILKAYAQLTSKLKVKERADSESQPCYLF